jgi:hypothetical protein
MNVLKALSIVLVNDEQMNLENPWNDPDRRNPIKPVAVLLFPPQILCVLAWD